MNSMVNRMIEKIKTAYFWVTCSILFAIGFRLFNISKESLWLDEIGQVIATEGSFSNLISAVSIHMSPPLDYIITKMILYVGQADWLVRFPSFLFGGLASYFMFLFVKQLVNKQTALIALVLFAFAPMAIAYSQEGRMYSLFLCLSILSYYFTAKSIASQDRGSLVWLGIVNGFLFLTHYFSVFIIISEVVLVVIAMLKKRDKNWKSFFIHLAITVLFVGIWMPILLAQIKSHAGLASYGLPFNILFFKVPLSMFSSLEFFGLRFWSYLILFGLGIVLAIVKKESKLVVVACVGGLLMTLFYLISSKHQLTTSRNLIFLLPIYLTVIAFSVVTIMNRFKLHYIAQIILVAGLTVQPAIHYHTQSTQYSKQPFKQVSRYLEKQQVEDKVMVKDIVGRGLLAYYFDNDKNYTYLQKKWMDPTNLPGNKIWILNALLVEQMKANTLKGWLVLNAVENKDVKTISQDSLQLVKQFGEKDKALYLYSINNEK